MSQVFISYRHCQHGHSDRVKNLIHALRQVGVNILCDQQLTGGPNEGWTMWSQQQVERADKLLIACTAGWAECYYEANQLLPAGLSSVTEARIIRGELADNVKCTCKYKLVRLCRTNLYLQVHWEVMGSYAKKTGIV